MTDADEFDATLREAFHRSEQNGDASGVADAIRSRVAAGDPGASVAGSTAPGWGGSGITGWLPWLGVVVVAGIVGGVVGSTGILSGPAIEPEPVGSSVVLPHTVDARACEGGPIVASIAADTRVLAVQRSEDSLWAGVRNPSAVGSTVWVPVDAIGVDDGEPPLAGLPVGGGCPIVIAVSETPVPVPTDDPQDPSPTQAPDPDPTTEPVPNPPAGDTTPPVIQQMAINVSGCPAIIQVVATDNVAVTQVTLSWSGVATGSAEMSLVGGTWRYSYDSFNSPEGAMTFSAVARDAAGNASQPAVQAIGMACLL